MTYIRARRGAVRCGAGRSSSEIGTGFGWRVAPIS